jgi:hypothetical protein
VGQHDQSRRVPIFACREERDTSRESDRFKFREDRRHKPGLGSWAASGSGLLICGRATDNPAPTHEFITIPAAMCTHITAMTVSFMGGSGHEPTHELKTARRTEERDRQMPHRARSEWSFAQAVTKRSDAFLVFCFTPSDRRKSTAQRCVARDFYKAFLHDTIEDWLQLMTLECSRPQTHGPSCGMVAALLRFDANYA